ncbi:putative mutator protein MutT4 [compost metagenome]
MKDMQIKNREDAKPLKRVDVTYSLITDNSKSKVLMVHNIDHENWSLPGGAVEINETLEQSIIREVREETGLDIKVFGIVAVNECKFEKLNEHAIFFTFRAEIIGGNVGINRPEEIGGITWIDIKKAEELMPYYKDGLQKLIDGNEISYFDQGSK